MKYFDSHVHLNSPQFEGRVDELWTAAREAGVHRATVIGYDLPTSRKAVEIASRHDNLFATVGISPHEYENAPEGYLDEIESLASHDKVVAIGEAGLEYHYPVGDETFQWNHFRPHIDLANRLGKTLVIHLRDGDSHFLRILDNHPPKRAILHCFTASLDVMQAAVDRGYGVSFSGIVTFKKAVEIHEAARQVPLENLLIETDAPYLAPVPFRGKTCEPHMVVHTASHIAALRGIPVDDIAIHSYRNACRLFDLSEE